MSIQGWFPLRLTGLISLLSKELSGVFSSTTVQRHQFQSSKASAPQFEGISSLGHLLSAYPVPHLICPSTLLPRKISFSISAPHFLSWDSKDMNLDLLLSHRSLRLDYFSSSILYCLGWRMSTDLSSSSLSSSVISILLFSPSSEPFTLVFVFFSPNISIWLFL